MSTKASIKVRYFASLKESLGRPEDSLDFAGSITVRELWCRVNPGQPLPANILAAVNMDYVGLDSPVSGGDEVAFFPPVTGG
ncbi:MAG: MoaD/ThiS family protein [Methylovulum sp.]|nr:MAG: MoaD/ThiS family protein [Methylovulum sp.]